MVGRQGKRQAADVLVVYGYHADETFHQKVVTDLRKKNLSNVKYEMYDGKRITREKDITGYPLLNFLKKLPYHTDYVVELHDSPKARDTKELEIPYFEINFESHMPQYDQLKQDLYLLRKDLEKLGNRHVENNKTHLPGDDSPHNFALYNIELYPKYSTRHEAVMQLEGLISTLQKHPIYKTNRKARRFL